ncbi:MAG: hypothetical protein LBV04_02405 [Deferribacteraceae bacterium]|jgi:hypothetical protein|nr:hypothetical protein [Deferribacteraceae bacterium]
MALEQCLKTLDDIITQPSEYDEWWKASTNGLQAGRDAFAKGERNKDMLRYIMETAYRNCGGLYEQGWDAFMDTFFDITDL